MTEVPPVLVMLLGPVAAVIPLTYIPDIVHTSNTFVPLPLIVTVITVALVSTGVTAVTLVPVKLPLPAEVNSKLAGAVSINVPKVLISSFATSVITMLPRGKGEVGKEAQALTVKLGTVIVTVAKEYLPQSRARENSMNIFLLFISNTNDYPNKLMCTN